MEMSTVGWRLTGAECARAPDWQVRMHGRLDGCRRAVDVWAGLNTCADARCMRMASKCSVDACIRACERCGNAVADSSTEQRSGSTVRSKVHAPQLSARLQCQFNLHARSWLLLYGCFSSVTAYSSWRRYTQLAASAYFQRAGCIGASCKGLGIGSH